MTHHHTFTLKAVRDDRGHVSSSS